MKPEFLLSTGLAKDLYGEAEKLPIVDYHNHLSVRDLALNRKFTDLGELWLVSDPYKHRALRILGVEERLITGDVSNEEKFAVWAKNLPRLIGNPLYHWSQLEMTRVFGFDEPLSEHNAMAVWQNVNEKLQQDEYAALKLLERFNVETICPCAGLLDDLTSFKLLSTESQPKVVPSMRGDDIFKADSKFWQCLSELSGTEIVSLSTLQTALGRRLDEFSELGCRFADHSLDGGFVYVADDGKNEIRLSRLLKGDKLSEKDQVALQAELLRILGDEYVRLNWAVQLHVGAQRFTSSRLRDKAGPTGGFACIGQSCRVADIAMLLDDWEQGPGGMPHVILFTLNPADNAVMATLTGSFAADCMPGKVQFGPAWWLNDHIYGMHEHFEALAAYGVLSTFIGMTTDSRSLLSYVRHEYYRRVLCNWIAGKVATGEFPDEPDLLKDMVSALCYGNAINYFKD